MGLLKSFAGLFFDVEGIKEANAEFKNRIAEIDADYEEKKRYNQYQQNKAKEQFRETIAANTNARNAKLGRVSRA